MGCDWLCRHEDRPGLAGDADDDSALGASGRRGRALLGTSALGDSAAGDCVRGLPGDRRQRGHVGSGQADEQCGRAGRQWRPRLVRGDPRGGERYWRTELAETLAGLGPNWRVGQVVGAGHFIQLFAAPQVNAMVDRFLEVTGL